MARDASLSDKQCNFFLAMQMPVFKSRGDFAESCLGRNFPPRQLIKVGRVLCRFKVQGKLWSIFVAYFLLCISYLCSFDNIGY